MSATAGAGRGRGDARGRGVLAGRPGRLLPEGRQDHSLGSRGRLAGPRLPPIPRPFLSLLRERCQRLRAGIEVAGRGEGRRWGAGCTALLSGALGQSGRQTRPRARARGGGGLRGRIEGREPAESCPWAPVGPRFRATCPHTPFPQRPALGAVGPRPRPFPASGYCSLFGNV